MDLTLTIKGITLSQATLLEDFMNDHALVFQKLEWPELRDRWKANYGNIKFKTDVEFKQQYQGDWNAYQPCLFDALPPADKHMTYGMVCNCPKCSIQC